MLRTTSITTINTCPRRPSTRIPLGLARACALKQHQWSHNFIALLTASVHRDFHVSTNSLGERISQRADAIVPGDLKATLEAHRRRYQETVIRWKYSIRGDAASHGPEDWKVVTGIAGPGKKDAERSRNREREGRLRDISTSQDKALQNSHHRRPRQDELDQEQTAIVKRTITYLRSERDAGRRRGFDTGPGRNIKPARAGNFADPPFWPLASSNRPVARDTDREQLLSSDIAGLTRWMQLTRREDDIRHALARAIMAEISQAEGDIEWVMQGSQTTGLATSTSDVDLAFTVPSNSETKPGRRGPNTPRTRHVQKRRLHDKLIRMSKFLGWHGFEDFVLVSSKYPLLRATHQASGIKFQLVMVESQPAQRERVKMYLEEYPHLRGVYCVLRAALAARVGLFEPMEGGLGSYPLLILIVLAFKTAKLSRTESAAIALKAVLDFVITWDTNETAYVVDPVEALQKTQGKPVPNLKLKRIIKEDATVYAKHRMAEADLARPWQPCYLEPDNLLNNLGKNAYRWRDIKMTFRALNHDIDRYLSAAEITNSHAATGLASFFGRSLEKYRDKRAQLEVWAMTQDGGEALSLIRQQKLPETVARPRKDTSSVT